LPFTATNLDGVAAQVVSGDVLKVHAVSPHVPEGVAAVVDRALSFVPEERHPDMASFAYALALSAHRSGANLPEDPDPVGLPSFGALHVRGDAWASGPLVISAGMPAAGALAKPVGSANSVQASTTQRRRWGGVMLAFGLLMSLIGVASWSLLRRRSTEQSVPVPPVIAPPTREAAHPDTSASAPIAPRAAPTPGSQGELSAPSVPTSIPPRATAPERQTALVSEPPHTTRPSAPRTHPASRLGVDANARSKHEAAKPKRAAQRNARTSANEFEKEWM
jgi:hypothetical protein